MFRIKICGVTRPEDAAHAVEYGAEAIGINFFPGSPRFVREGVAREIVEAVADRAEVVGVFVNEPPGKIVALCGRVGIRRVQLHGDEPPVPLRRRREGRLRRDGSGTGVGGPREAVSGGRRRAGSGRRAEAVAPCRGAHAGKRRARHPRGTPVRGRCRLRRGIVPWKERPGQGENVHRTRERGVPQCRSLRGTGYRIRRATSAASAEGTSPRR
ncbi:MAG: trpF [Deltaproteobacteria bacterium]|nr:trpF [Deltaproteobacteria bacterium]